MYSTDLSVDDAAKAIIQAIDGGTEGCAEEWGR